MNLTPIVIAGVIAIILFTFLRVLFEKLERSTKANRYKKIPYLLSPTEGYFLRELAKVLPEDVLVFTKVRLCDVVEPSVPKGNSNYIRAFNRIAKKHLDFVLCREMDFSILGVVELDDRTHLRASRIARDKFVDEIMKHCGVPILHVKVRSTYDAKALLKEVEETILLPKPEIKDEK